MLTVSSGFPAWSRWARRLRADLAEGADSACLAAALEELPLERAVLFPCSDLWAEAVNRLPDATTARFVPAVPPGRGVEILLDKWLLAVEAVRLGLPHPETHRVRSPSDLSTLDDTGLAFLLKPRSSQRFYRTFHAKAFAVTSRLDAKARLNAAAQHGLELLLQEYVPGPPTSHVLVDGYADQGGRIVACLARRRVKAHPPDLGDSTTVVSIPLGEAAAAVEVVHRLLSGIAYRGMFSACFKEDARDGQPKLIEVNCRPWAHIEFAARCGIDFALMAYRDALGHPLLRAAGYRVGVRGTFCLPELASLRVGLGQGCPRRELAAGVIRAFTPHGPLDPLPGIAHAAGTLRRALDRRVTIS